MSMTIVPPKNVLKNGEIYEPAPTDGRSISSFNTSPFDSLMEILGHTIRQCQNVGEYFKNNRDSEKAKLHLCYATAALNFAKHGPNNDAYQLRNTLFHHMSTMERSHVAYDLYSPLSVLKILLENYVDVGQVKSCNSCFSFKWSLSLKAGSVYEITASMGSEILYRKTEILGWKEEIDKYFAEEEYLCYKCSSGMLSNTLPLLCISGAENDVSMFHEHFLKTKVPTVIKNSLEVLPVKFAKERCYYVLCGVIGRTSLTNKLGSHYVAYCRDANGQWNKRDSLNEETEILTQLPVVDIVQFFYANIGCWDADERKILLEPTKSAWLEITNIRLPDLCLEKILSYLDNRQLEFLLHGMEKNQSIEVAINRLWKEKAEMERMPEGKTVFLKSLPDY